MVSSFDLSSQLIHRLRTGHPVLFTDQSDIDPGSDIPTVDITTPGRGNLDDVVIRTSRLTRPPSVPPFADVDLSTQLGDKRGTGVIPFKDPLFLPSQLRCGSDEDHRIGLSFGSVLSGMPINIECNRYGEMMEEMISSHSPPTIFRWSPEVHDFDISLLKRSNGVEIVISQPGPIGTCGQQSDRGDIYLDFPIHHPELKKGKDLKDMIKMIRQVNKGPIIGTISASDIDSDLDYLLVSGIDCVHVICGDNSTLSSGGQDPFSRDILTTLVEMKKHFDTFLSRKEGVKLMISGPFLDSYDIFKALCFGADIVGLDHVITSSMKLIESGSFSRSSQGSMEEGSGWDMIGEYIHNLHLSFSRELNILCGSLGVRSRKDLNEDLLEATTYEAAACTGLPLYGHGERLGMWKH